MKEATDIESLRTEHESDEQWAVRRNFMMAHKDKYTEEELVTLAQLFTNIEFLGCRYNKHIMEDISNLTKTIITKKLRNENIFGFETEHWSNQYSGRILSRMPWIITDIKCTSHGKCPANKRLLATNIRSVKVERELIVPKKKMRRMQTSDICQREREGVNMKKLLEEPEKKILKPEINKCRRKIQYKHGENTNVDRVKKTAEIKKLIDDLGKKIKNLNFSKTNDDDGEDKDEYDEDMIRIDYNQERKLNERMKQVDVLEDSKLPQCSYHLNSKGFINKKVTNDTYKGKAKKNDYIREIHPLLRENTAYVISKDNSERFNSHIEVAEVIRLLKEFLCDTLEIPENDIQHYGKVTNNTEIMFAVKNANAAKFIINKILENQNNKYVIQRYNFVKAAILIPNEPKYFKNNIFKWLEYLNNHVEIKPTEWTVLYEQVIDNTRNMFVTIPRSDAIALHECHNNLDYVDVRVKVILFPKAKKNNRTNIKNNKGVTSSPNQSTSKVDENKHLEEVLVIFSLPNYSCKFGEEPISDIEAWNDIAEVDFEKWREMFVNYYKTKLVVSMPTSDAFKLTCRKNLKYCDCVLDVQIPDME